MHAGRRVGPSCPCIFFPLVLLHCRSSFFMFALAIVLHNLSPYLTGHSPSPCLPFAADVIGAIDATALTIKQLSVSTSTTTATSPVLSQQIAAYLPVHLGGC